MSPCKGHVTEIPVSDFDVPLFGDPVFTQQQQQEQPLQQEQQKVPLPSTMHTKHTAAAAAAGSGEQQATDVVDVTDDPENPEKGTKKFTKVLPDPVNKETYLYKEYHCYHVNIKDPKYNTKRGAPTSFIPKDTMCHCGETFDNSGEVDQHVSQDHPANCTWTCFFLWCNHIKKGIHMETCWDTTFKSLSRFVNLKIVIRGRMARNLEIMSS